MKNKFKYNTVTSAIDALRKEGFINDFNLCEDHIVCGETALQVDDLDIKVLYRYEGDSDPADEATVYGLESKEGLKGILVLGDETDSDETATETLKKLHLKKNRSKKLHLKSD
jgi:hypothetical protein